MIYICLAEALGLTNPNYYFYLNQSSTATVEGIDDKKEFNDTLVSPYLSLMSETKLFNIIKTFQIKIVLTNTWWCISTFDWLGFFKQKFEGVVVIHSCILVYHC